MKHSVILVGYGMFILRAETRAEAEAIAFQEPNTKAGLRTMKVVPWLRGEGDINISISFTNGTVKIDRRVICSKTVDLPVTDARTMRVASTPAAFVITT